MEECRDLFRKIPQSYERESFLGTATIAAYALVMRGSMTYVPDARDLPAHMSFCDEAVELMRCVERGDIPEYVPSVSLMASFEGLMLRRWLSEIYGMWALVALEWLQPFVHSNHLENKRILDVGCGVFPWLGKALLQCDGVENVRCVDNHSDNVRGATDLKSSSFPPVEHMDGVEAIHRYRSTTDVLVLSWPRRDDGYDMLSMLYTYSTAGGDDKRILYIGEPRGNATACDAFFDGWHVDAVCDEYRSWTGCFDRVELGRFTPVCQACKVAPETVLKRCTGCKRRWYCGKECQRADWPLHQETCRKYRF